MSIYYEVWSDFTKSFFGLLHSDRGATLKLKKGGGGVKHFFWVTLYNFQKKCVCV